MTASQLLQQSAEPFDKAWTKVRDYEQLIAQLCRDLNQAHDEICKLQGLDPETNDWPDWTPQANSIRWAARLIEKPLSKTNKPI